MLKVKPSPQDEIKSLVSSLLLKSEFTGTHENLAAGGTLLNLSKNLSAELISDRFTNNGLVQQLVRLELIALDRLLECVPTVYGEALKSIKGGELPTSLISDDLYPAYSLDMAA